MIDCGVRSKCYALPNPLRLMQRVSEFCRSKPYTDVVRVNLQSRQLHWNTGVALEERSIYSETISLTSCTHWYHTLPCSSLLPNTFILHIHSILSADRLHTTTGAIAVARSPTSLYMRRTDLVSLGTEKGYLLTYKACRVAASPPCSCTMLHARLILFF